jgi:hypothetical protein
MIVLSPSIFIKTNISLSEAKGLSEERQNGNTYFGGMRKAPSSRIQQPLSIVFSIM